MKVTNEWKPMFYAMLVAMVIVAFGSALTSCTFASGTEGAVDTPFGGGSISSPSVEAAAERMERELMTCKAPYMAHMDNPIAMQELCSCHLRRGQTNDYFFMTNCLRLRGSTTPPVPAIEQPQVAPQSPRGGQLEANLKAAEGLAVEPYLLDGVLHTGYGHNVQANAVLHEDMETAKAAASTVVGEDVYNGLSQRRKDALAELAFHVGEEGLRRFVELVRAVRNNLFHKAADELMDSDLGRKFPTRATRLANALRNG